MREDSFPLEGSLRCLSRHDTSHRVKVENKSNQEKTKIQQIRLLSLISPPTLSHVLALQYLQSTTNELLSPSPIFCFLQFTRFCIFLFPLLTPNFFFWNLFFSFPQFAVSCSGRKWVQVGGWNVGEQREENKNQKRRTFSLFQASCCQLHCIHPQGQLKNRMS